MTETKTAPEPIKIEAMNQKKQIQTEGPLFEDIQNQNIFPDCKTLVDSTPNGDPAKIEAEYHHNKNNPNFDLRNFAEENFSTDEEKKQIKIKRQPSMEKHIESLWPLLTYDPNKNPLPNSTLIPLPHSYIVPGGRFQELYYWDSYFTAEGLACSNHLNIVINIAKNFSHLIETIGHIPNASRTYCLSRSQPPFFSLLLDIIQRHNGIQSIEPFISALEKEYQFWMDDKNRRVVRMEDGSLLNRYWDNEAKPRPESYREDTAAYQQANPQNRDHIYRNIRAACESGWDFSSRWFKDQKNIETIYTTELIPVDLNALLYHTEMKLAELYEYKKEQNKAQTYRRTAEQRKIAINHYCWNNEKQFYVDHCWTEKKYSTAMTLAATMPLFCKLSTKEQASSVAKQLEQHFLQPGGLVTTLVETGQQWDKPNGWAPLHWIAIQGLVNYQLNDLAKEIVKRWVRLNRAVFQRAKKMTEKYNVCDTTLEAGGGEYKPQDGFGWTNGVAIALIRQFTID